MKTEFNFITSEGGYEIFLKITDFFPGSDEDAPEFNVEKALFIYFRKDGRHVIPIPAAFADYLTEIYSEDIIQHGRYLLSDELTSSYLHMIDKFTEGL